MTLNNIQTLQALRQQEWPVTDYQVLDWDNAFFITTYRPGQTLMMLTNGQPLVVNRTVKEMVNEFAEAKQIWQLDTKCFYLDSCHCPIAYVAGRHALVPRQGIRDENVVYYMSEKMVHHHFDRKLGGMILCFKDPAYDQEIKLLLDVASLRFEKILRKVDKIAARQESINRQAQEWLGLMEKVTWHESKQQNSDFLEWQKVWTSNMLEDFCEKMFGQPCNEACEEYMKHYFHRPYRI